MKPLSFEVVPRDTIVADGDGLRHQVGGAFRDDAVCPNCSVALPVVAVLSFDDERLAALAASWPAPVDGVPLLFCWRCPAREGALAYRCDAARFEVLRIRRGDRDGFPYANYPDVMWTAWGVIGGATPRDERRRSWVMPGPAKRLRRCPECDGAVHELARIWDPVHPVSFCANPDVAMEFAWCSGCGAIEAEAYMEP